MDARDCSVQDVNLNSGGHVEVIASYEIPTTGGQHVEFCQLDVVGAQHLHGEKYDISSDPICGRDQLLNVDNEVSDFRNASADDRLQLEDLPNAHIPALEEEIKQDFLLNNLPEAYRVALAGGDFSVVSQGSSIENEGRLLIADLIETEFPRLEDDGFHADDTLSITEQDIDIATEESSHAVGVASSSHSIMEVSVDIGQQTPSFITEDPSREGYFVTEDPSREGYFVTEDPSREGYFVNVSLNDFTGSLHTEPNDCLAATSSSNTSSRSSLSAHKLTSTPSVDDENLASLFDSPILQEEMVVRPNASIELMSMIDSAIQGSDQNSLERLKNVISGKDILLQEFRDLDTILTLVVDVLVAKMGGVECKDEKSCSAPGMMLSAGAAVVAGEVIPWLPAKEDDEKTSSPRTKMIKGLLMVLQSCTRNRAMCSAAGLLQVLLQAVKIVFTSDCAETSTCIGPLLNAIEILGAHSLTVPDLQTWLHTVSETLSTARSRELVLTLEKAMSGEETRGPSYTFEFDGESSGLLGPGETRWPFVNGYAFATWLYIESFADTLNTATTAAAVAAAAVAKVGKASPMSAAAAASALAGEGTAHMPRLFSFLTADNQGIEAYFHGQFLVVEIASGKGRKASLHFTHAFESHCWYFVGLEHSFKQSLLGKSESELKLYINEQLYESRQFEFPRISKPLAFCCVGTNPPPAMAGLQRRRRQCPLFAEMGPVYIFKEPIGHDKMIRMALRGGDAVPMFGSGAGMPWLATNNQAMILAECSAALDADIGPKLHLLYHPKLLVGRTCVDASPLGAAGLHRKPAEVLGHVHVAVRSKPVEAMWAMGEGGCLALLPLTVGCIDKETFQPCIGEISLSSRAALLSPSILRILSLALQHPGNAEEMVRSHGPELLSHILRHLFCIKNNLSEPNDEEHNEELVAAVVALCQAPSKNQTLKTHLYSCLLLDLKLWSRCSYGLQKKLLSSLADMVFSEELTMRTANAVQMLLDGCRYCYWTVAEPGSLHGFAGERLPRPVGELNALVDELLVIVELLIGSAQGLAADAEVHHLIQFVLDCPQPNQVTRILHLMYRLITQPNASRAATFAELLIKNGGAEMILILLQREIEKGENAPFLPPIKSGQEHEDKSEKTKTHHMEYSEIKDDIEKGATGLSSRKTVAGSRNLGGISLSIRADSARNDFTNTDRGDGEVVIIISLLGALMAGQHLNFFAADQPSVKVEDVEEASKGTWLLYALQKAFQTAPRRLLTSNAYMSLLAAVVKSEVGTLFSEDRLVIFDSIHRFEHNQLLLALLRSLPYASSELQHRALQDIFLLACSRLENRMQLVEMPEWPEWLLEVLISSYEVIPCTMPEEVARLQEIQDLAFGFLTVILEHSMRLKDGWKDVEAAIHSAEWLAILGGSSMGEKRLRREESLSVIKRKLLGSLLDFSTGELQKQTQVIAAAAAGVAAGGLSPREAKVEAEAAAHLSMSLAENSLVLLMLVEDHLRLQCQTYNLNLLSGRRASFDGVGNPSFKMSSMGDANGQVPVERISASAAAEPYESVRCAFASYGSCGVELAEGWKCRSRIWYGVDLPPKEATLGGGGGGWDSWDAVLEKDENGVWVELPLVKKCIIMLQALLLDKSGPGGAGLGSTGTGGTGGTGTGSVQILQHLLDSDQPFYAMLRLILLAMRESDQASLLQENKADDPQTSREELSHESHDGQESEAQSLLLWRVLAPLLTMPLWESRRQRVLVASCIFYSELWHAVSSEKLILRKKYVEAIIPPFTALLRRWRPLLSGIHELTDADGQSPLAVEDRSLATDALPMEAALAMISPAWAAAFASPPAAMALAMAAAGVGGGEATASKGFHIRHDAANVERKFLQFRSFSGFQKPLDSTLLSGMAMPRDKASAKAAALAAARDQERTAKIGSGRGLAAVAMATSSQRRTVRDGERARQWAIFEFMGTAWIECFSPNEVNSSDKDKQANNKLLSVLHAMVNTSRQIQMAEINRLVLALGVAELRMTSGARSWRLLICRLLEMDALFGTFGRQLVFAGVLWKLDPMENSLRMRKRVKRNYKGTDHHGAAADYKEEKPQQKSKELQCNSLVPPGAALLVPVQSALEEVPEEEVNKLDLTDSEEVKEDYVHQPLNDPTENISYSPEDGRLSTSNPAVMNTIFSSKPTEELVMEVSAVMVQPLRVLAGMFKVTSKHISFVIDRHQRCEESAINVDEKKIQHIKDKIWPISSLREVHSRRYLLRKSALELFMVDKSNYFFNFESAESKLKVYKAIVQGRPPHLNTIYAATQRPERLLKRTQLMEQWAHRQISNFEYLMQLNTLAGRTYNDITQYPVFPWILSDYTSKELDLANPNVFRDLSKPVGALNPSRSAKILERYENFDDPIIPKFHYGSHYSSAGTVLYYLLRVEPYTSLSIQLQGGKFDHADRMFGDISTTWNGVLEDMGDVKELVPEFFYLPEMLVNGNNYNLGHTQLGEILGDVKLPPWATNAIDFMQKHRAALESEYVSEHLHEWIDLIFGYKQQGVEAITAQNLFFYMTYEGAVDIDKITDPALHKATQDQIAYFGQTPSQLLKTPHIRRLSITDVLQIQTIFHNPEANKIYMVPIQECCNVPASNIATTADRVITLSMGAPACEIAVHGWQPNTPDGKGMPFVFHHGKSIANASSGTLMRMFKGVSGMERVHYPHVTALGAANINSEAVTAVSSDGRFVYTGGHADNSLKVVTTDNARVLECAFGHTAPITCLALASDGNTLVTGSRDGTAVLWKVHTNNPFSANTFGDPIMAASTLPSVVSDSAFVDLKRKQIEGPLHVLRGHGDALTCCCINTDLDLVVSCSRRKNIIFHSIIRGRYIRQLKRNRADAIALSSEGIIVIWDKVTKILESCTLNGVLVARTSFGVDGADISSILTSIDSLHIVIGTSCKKIPAQERIWHESTRSKDRSSSSKNLCSLREDDWRKTDPCPDEGCRPLPSIYLLDIYSLQSVHRFDLEEEQHITAMSLNRDNTNLLISTANGQLLVLTDPGLSVKLVDQMLRLGWEGSGLTSYLA